ncbi:nucleotide-binding protein [Microbacterium sp.]|uniref:nucleotide-binding protein n=1 Tax=Microbacterium sp. TaxID=51671 RepID=UPI0039E4F562
MTDLRPGLVFDTGPLRHFALQGWLGVLKYLGRDCQVIIPESVEAELKAQSQTDPELRQVLEADWITVDRSTDLTYVQAFAGFERLLAAGGRNLGECGVLALGQARGHQLIIDDRVASNLARRAGLDSRGTLALLCDAIREQKLTVAMVSDLADDLLIGEYRLPFAKGRFAQWADENGLI